VFDKNAEIVEVPDDNSILNVGYTFIPIKEVAQIAGNQYIDVCGIVRDIGALSKITVKSGESKSKRLISICDDSNSSIEVCLWTE
jgi:replication factor A1